MNFRSSSAKTLVGSVIAMVERRADPAERDDLVLVGGLGRHQLDDGGVDLELVQRDGRHAVLLGQQRRDLLVLHEAELHQIGAQLAAALALVAQRLLELFGRDPLLLEKQLANPYRHVVVSAVSCPSQRARTHRARLGPSKGLHRNPSGASLHTGTQGLQFPLPFRLAAPPAADLSLRSAAPSWCAFGQLSRARRLRNLPSAHSLARMHRAEPAAGTPSAPTRSHTLSAT